MISSLTLEQHRTWQSYRQLADDVVAPRARDHDTAQVIDRGLVKELARQGWLGSLLPPDSAGRGADPVSYGLMSEELGRTCSTTRNLVAVEDMVAHSIWRWGTPAQRERWLPGIAAGDVVAAFALTEPDVGSDAAAVGTQVDDDGDGFVLRGTKKWISFGQIADVLLVIASYRGRPAAFLVEGDTAGVHVEPLRDLLGLRGSMLAEITFDACRLPADSLVGAPGAGLLFVASSALEIGRYSTAWGCVGLAQACLESAAEHAAERVQYGAPIVEHQLVQRMLADMVAGSRAARLLCWQAGVARQQGDPDAVNLTLLAKYFASATAGRIAADAVQIQGARGVSAGSPVERLYRDAKVMEIIEGTTQLHQSMLGRWGAVSAAGSRR